MWRHSIKIGFLASGGLLFSWIAPVSSQELPDLSKVILDSRQGVVSITTEEEQGQKLVPDDLLEELQNTPLMDVLKQLYGERLDEKLSGKKPTLASGTIITADGYIVTNYHVVDGSKTINIHLPNKGEYIAKVVGTDPVTDLALLKITVKDLHFLSFADSNKVKVGEWVLAIGSPYGFENSATIGIVSATGRSLIGERYIPFIQSDVAINPGNSGGPLLNTKGEVIGINSQILSDSGSFVGLSFSMPSNLVKNVIEQLKTKGKVTRGWVGVALQQIDKGLADSFGMAQAKGALVSRVEPESPAAKAGLMQGDVIISLNDHEIIDATDLPPIIGMAPLNAKLIVKYLRDNKMKEGEMVLVVEQQFKKEEKKTKPVSLVDTSISTMPILVRDLEPFEAGPASKGTKGVIVMEIRVAKWRDAGIRRGDKILAINSADISDKEQFYKVLKDYKDKSVALLVLREGETQKYIPIKSK